MIDATAAMLYGDMSDFLVSRGARPGMPVLVFKDQKEPTDFLLCYHPDFRGHNGHLKLQGTKYEDHCLYFLEENLLRMEGLEVENFDEDEIDNNNDYDDYYSNDFDDDDYYDEDYDDDGDDEDYDDDDDDEYNDDIQFNMVNSPSHYNKGKYEVIDVIKEMLTEEEFRGYIKGNVMKYVMREGAKDGTQDLAKAEFYLHYLRTGKKGI